MFDSYSHPITGTSSLTTFENIENLIDHLMKRFRAIDRFDVHPLVVKKLAVFEKHESNYSLSRKWMCEKKQKKKEYLRHKRENETDEERNARLKYQKEYGRNEIFNESIEAKEKRLENQRKYEEIKILNESIGEKEKRLENQHEYEEIKILNESIEEKVVRIKRVRDSQKEKINKIYSKIINAKQTSLKQCLFKMEKNHLDEDEIFRQFFV